MAVAFQQIPVDWRVPGTYMEIDPRFADSGTGTFPLRALIIAQMVSAGSGTALSPFRLTDEGQIEGLAGAGSMAHRMCREWLKHNKVTETDVILITDLVAGVQATGVIDFGGTISAGTLFLYVGGDRIAVLVASTDTVQDVATNTAAAINATHGACVTAVVNPGDDTQVLLTARNKGSVGNTIDLRAAHLAGESVPTGLTVGFTAMNGGTGNNTAGLTSAFGAVDGVQYDVIVHPYVDTSSLIEVENELEARADAMSAIPGVAFVGHAGSQGVLAAIGDARNSPYSSIIGFETFPGVPVERAAAVAAVVAKFGANDPARPFQTLPIEGYAPAQAERFSDAARNLLLHDGISTVKVGAGDQVQICRLITTYQETAGGAPSDAYLDVNTLLTLSYVRKSFVATMNGLFPRAKLAEDGGPTPGAGSALVSPSIYKAHAVAWYEGLVALELVENLDGFKANSTFATNGPDRIDAVLAVYLISPLRMAAVLNQFRK